MKVIFDYCRQLRKYADNEGFCLIRLENGDNVDDIIGEYCKEREWYERKYFTPKRLDKYIDRTYSYEESRYIDKVYEGDLILFKTSMAYLD